MIIILRNMEMLMVRKREYIGIMALSEQAILLMAQSIQERFIHVATANHGLCIQPCQAVTVPRWQIMTTHGRLHITGTLLIVEVLLRALALLFLMLSFPQSNLLRLTSMVLQFQDPLRFTL